MRVMDKELLITQMDHGGQESEKIGKGMNFELSM